MISDPDIVSINEVIKLVIEKLEVALQLNPSNFYTLYILFCTCRSGTVFLTEHRLTNIDTNFYQLKLIDYSFKLLDRPAIPYQYEYVKTECFYQLAYIFLEFRNCHAALKYSKLAYEHCLRSSDHTLLSDLKSEYLKCRAAFAKLPPLRFAVGDEVEFLHELEAGSEWKLGRVVELYYRELSFDISFTAPYRLQLCGDSDATDDSPVYAWAKADLDRYVRKVGVRSIEDTRYQARLDAKVKELAQVYCSSEFIHDISRTLAQDREFVEMLQSVWQIELSEATIRSYRQLVMYMHPLVPTDSGYHVPSSEEVIAGIRAFFDPAHLSGDAAPLAGGENSDLKRVRAEILDLFRDILPAVPHAIDNSEFHKLLFESIRYYDASLSRLDSSGSFTRISDCGRGLTVPVQVSEAIWKASTVGDLRLLQPHCADDVRLEKFVLAWISLHICLENPDAAAACECPFVYFFVKFCIDRGLGVPKLALAVYDRMNMQLSREFIRCANPTCELNRLDQSSGHVRFKQCSRCHAVI